MLPKMSLEQPELLASFYEHHPDAACLVDNDGRLIRVNEAAIRLFGYTREEMRQLTIERLLKGTVSEPGLEAERYDASFRTIRTPSRREPHLREDEDDPAAMRRASVGPISRVRGDRSHAGTARQLREYP